MPLHQQAVIACTRPFSDATIAVRRVSGGVSELAVRPWGDDYQVVYAPQLAEGPAP